MNMPSEEHDAFRDVVRDFARRELAPHVDRWEAGRELPLEAVAKMADLGLFGIAFEEQWGGGGGDSDVYRRRRPASPRIRVSAVSVQGAHRLELSAVRRPADDPRRLAR